MNSKKRKKTSNLLLLRNKGNGISNPIPDLSPDYHYDETTHTAPDDWYDKIGSNHFTQNVGIVEGTQNGLTVWTNSLSNKYLEDTANSALDFSALDNYVTIYLVMKVESSANGRYLFHKADASDYIGILYYPDATGRLFRVKSGSIYLETSASEANLPNGEWGVWTMRLKNIANDGALQVFKNGAVFGTEKTSGSYPVTAGSANAVLFNTTAHNLACNGGIGELIMFKGNSAHANHSTETVLSVATYLMSKWGIS
jgi:hypothetical protein